MYGNILCFARKKWYFARGGDFLHKKALLQWQNVTVWSTLNMLTCQKINQRLMAKIEANINKIQAFFCELSFYALWVNFGQKYSFWCAQKLSLEKRRGKIFSMKASNMVSTHYSRLLKKWKIFVYYGACLEHWLKSSNNKAIVFNFDI